MKNSNISPKKKPYSKYIRAFGMDLHAIRNMDRLDFSCMFGRKFKYFSISKFKKEITKVANAYERGKEILNEYQ